VLLAQASGDQKVKMHFNVSDLTFVLDYRMSCPLNDIGSQIELLLYFLFFSQDLYTGKTNLPTPQHQVGSSVTAKLIVCEPFSLAGILGSLSCLNAPKSCVAMCKSKYRHT
jgi:hypothetical protein